MSFKLNLSQTLKEILSSQKMTQSELAKILKTTKQCISLWVKKESKFLTNKAIEKILEVDITIHPYLLVLKAHIFEYKATLVRTQNMRDYMRAYRERNLDRFAKYKEKYRGKNKKIKGENAIG